jgi:hypothetical protein
LPLIAVAISHKLPNKKASPVIGHLWLPPQLPAARSMPTVIFRRADTQDWQASPSCANITWKCL